MAPPAPPGSAAYRRAIGQEALLLLCRLQAMLLCTGTADWARVAAMCCKPHAPREFWTCAPPQLRSLSCVMLAQVRCSTPPRLRML